MKKLILLLLIVGCEEPAIEGCMDDTACNYNSEATVDDGSCEYFDECGVCAGDGSSCSSTVTDIDGNVYETVQIGEQLWMAKNLKVTKYRDGSEIPNITSDIYWSNLSTSAYAVYDNNFSNADIYGNLYNWYAVDDDRGLVSEEV